MYEYLKDVLNLAETVAGNDGAIDNVSMDQLGGSLDRITVIGTANSKPFEITLEVGEWKRNECGKNTLEEDRF